MHEGKVFLFDGEGVKRDWLAELGAGIVDKTANNWQRHVSAL